MDNKEINEFCHRYDAQVHPSIRIVRRHKRVMYSEWRDNADIFQTIPYVDIKCVEVHMPEDQFRALIENKRWLDEREAYNRGFPHIHRVQNIIAEYEDETRLRHQHAGVMDAWQQYQTMLQLVK
jgi:hypothetical protein